MFIYNKDEAVRDKIIFGSYEPEKYTGGIRRFEDLTAEKLRELVEADFIDLHERHNLCPDVGTILRFMEQYSGYMATGYAISARRDDYRVSLDGLQKDGYDMESELDEFCGLFRKADDFSVGTKKMYCWFD